ncbi:hypothetical protein [Streptomyces sp. NPDC056264]|uniref:hypothetical protein n=1 Tax=Streptomyces sp. NPDC056264 TaxID=3345767 RepID=UPI003AAE7140
MHVLRPGGGSRPDLRHRFSHASILGGRRPEIDRARPRPEGSEKPNPGPGSSSVGHDACQPADETWVEGLCGGAGDYRPAAIGKLNCGVVGTRATLVHPNAAGHENVANHVERAIRIALLEH